MLSSIGLLVAQRYCFSYYKFIFYLEITDLTRLRKNNKVCVVEPMA